MKCKYCEKNIPDKCSGKIEEHCTWCGEFIKNDKNLKPDIDRWCNQECKKENDDWDLG